MGVSGTPGPVIQVSHIRKSYGATAAVSDVSFDVSEGEVFGLIGPNGAGKTTTMECVEGVRRPDAGQISIMGLDPFRDVGGWRQPRAPSVLRQDGPAAPPPSRSAFQRTDPSGEGL